MRPSLTKPDYYSQQRADLPPNRTIPEIYRSSTTTSAWWLTASFWLRDTLGRPFGLKPITGFGGDTILTEGEHAHFFTVLEVSDHRLLVAAEDHHLRVEVDLARPTPGEPLVTLTTQVWNKNWVGRLYMLPVGLVHPAICRALLRKAALHERTAH